MPNFVLPYYQRWLSTGLSSLTTRWFRCFYICCSAIILISSCEHHEKSPTTSTAAYNLAKSTFDDEKYFDSVTLFEDFITRYPYSQQQANAHLHRSEALFKTKQYASAAFAFERFRILHPSHPRQDYGLYMEGLSYWKMAPKAADKAQTQLHKALKLWAELAHSHPHSSYLQATADLVKQGKLKIVENKFIITKFYCQTKMWLNCILTVDNFIQQYQHQKTTASSLNLNDTKYLTQAAKMGIKALSKLETPKAQQSLDLDKHLITRQLTLSELNHYFSQLKLKWQPLISSP